MIFPLPKGDSNPDTRTSKVELVSGLMMVRRIEEIKPQVPKRPSHLISQDYNPAPIPLGASKAGKMMTGSFSSINPASPTTNSQFNLNHAQSRRRRPKDLNSGELEMAASSSRPIPVEERLKQLDEKLEKLKNMLQFQLDFLENLDSEAGRRMEQLEQDLSFVKIGFTEELDKLHQELKSPQEKFEDRIGDLEDKLSKLNLEWGESSEK
jgi:hypothetical protein